MKPQLSLTLFLFSALFLSQTLAIQLSYSPDEAICLLPPTNRGPPTSPSIIRSCEKGYDLVGEKCYAPCNPGYDFYWPGESGSKTCLEICPKGTVVTYGVCQYTGEYEGISHAYYYRSMGACERVHGSCYKKDDNSYMPMCSSPKANLIFQCKAQEQAREVAPARTRLECENGYENVDGLCYPDCGKGALGFGEACVGKCKAGWTQCGQFCTRGVSCKDAQIDNFREFLGYVQKGAEKNLINVDWSQLFCAK